MRYKSKMMTKNGKAQSGTYIGKYDLLKGLLMCFIVFGHSVTDFVKYWEYDYSLNYILLLFMAFSAVYLYGGIPLFFMTCAYGGRPRPIKSYTKSLLKSFIKPYAIMAICVAVGFVIRNIIEEREIINGFKYNVLPYFLGWCPAGTFYGINLGSIGPCWFFVTFILSGVLLNMVMYENKTWIQITLIVFMATIGVIAKNILLPFCIQQSMICCGYIYVGNMIRKQHLVEQKLPKYWLGLLLLFVWIVAINDFYRANTGVEISQNVYPGGLADVIAGYCAGFLLYLITVNLDSLQGKIPDMFRWIGRNALWACCIHTVAYTVIPWKSFSVIWSDNLMFGFLLELCINFLLVFGGCKLIGEYSTAMKRHRWRKMSNCEKKEDKYL